MSLSYEMESFNTNYLQVRPYPSRPCKNTTTFSFGFAYSCAGVSYPRLLSPSMAEILNPFNLTSALLFYKAEMMLKMLNLLWIPLLEFLKILYAGKYKFLKAINLTIK